MWSVNKCQGKNALRKREKTRVMHINMVYPSASKERKNILLKLACEYENLHKIYR